MLQQIKEVLLQQRSLIHSETAIEISHTLERVQYYSSRALRDTAKTLTDNVNLILESILDLTSGFSLVLPWISSSLNRTSIDTLLLRSRRALIVDLPSSYKAAFLRLTEAHSLTSLLEESHRYGAAHRIAYTAFRLGSMLYNHDKAANSIPYLKLACESGMTGLSSLSDLLAENPREMQAEKDISEMRFQLPSSHELLGLAYSAIRDKKDASEAYRQALLAAALLHERNGDSVETLGNNAAVSKILARYSKVSIFDLLLPPEKVSIKETHIAAGVNLREHTLAVLQEMQIKTLEPFLWKTEACAAVKCWLEQAEEAYRIVGMHMRQARYILP